MPSIPNSISRFTGRKSTKIMLVIILLQFVLLVSFFYGSAVPNPKPHGRSGDYDNSIEQIGDKEKTRPTPKQDESVKQNEAKAKCDCKDKDVKKEIRPDKGRSYASSDLGAALEMIKNMSPDEANVDSIVAAAQMIEDSGKNIVKKQELVECKYPEWTKDDVKDVVKYLASGNWKASSQPGSAVDNGTVFCDTLKKGGDWPVCMDRIKRSKDECVMYSVGIANEVQFDKLFQDDCTVYSFDPTTPQHKGVLPNFEPWGLSCGCDKARVRQYSHPMYGSIPEGSVLLCVDELMDIFGHDHIDVLKFDCEGCEWDIFAHLAKYNPDVLRSIDQIDVEFHVSDKHGITSHDRVGSLVYGGRALRDFGFRPYYFHLNAGGPGVENVIEELMGVGLVEKNCCYEYGLIRIPELDISQA